MTTPQVEVVCVGSILRDGKEVVEAHSTCTIVRTGSKIILVDTSDRSYRQRLLDGLSRAGMTPADVHVLVNTHGHFDHTSNNDLFPNAELYVHPADRMPGRSEPFEDGLSLGENVRLVHTPGHSLGSISVFIEGEERTVIAGDAIPTEDNYLKDLPPAHHVDRQMAVESMHRIIAWADVVVPGHGPAFPVKH